MSLQIKWIHTGTRTLAAGGRARIVKTSATRWMISGEGLT